MSDGDDTLREKGGEGYKDDLLVSYLVGLANSRMTISIYFSSPSFNDLRVDL